MFNIVCGMLTHYRCYVQTLLPQNVSVKFKNYMKNISKPIKVSFVHFILGVELSCPVRIISENLAILLYVVSKSTSTCIRHTHRGSTEEFSGS